MKFGLNVISFVCLAILYCGNTFAQTPTARLNVPDTFCISSVNIFSNIEIGLRNSPLDSYDLRFSSFYYDVQGTFDPNNAVLIPVGNGMFEILVSNDPLDFPQYLTYTSEIAVTATLIITNPQGLSDTATKTFVVRRMVNSYDYSLNSGRFSQPRIRYVCNGDTLFNPEPYTNYPTGAGCSSLIPDFSGINGQIINHDPIQRTFQYVVQGSVGRRVDLDFQVSCPECGLSPFLRGSVRYTNNAPLIIDPIFCSNDSVWRGDANNDGFCDMNDLMEVGIHFGKSTNGLQGYNSNSWSPHFAYNSPDTISNGSNLKHVDTYGSGDISQLDTLMVLLNYGKQHNKRGTDEIAKTGPPIRVELPAGPFRGGDVIIADIILGSATVTADDIYGAIMSMNITSGLVDSVKWHNTQDSSWFGKKNVDMLSLVHYLAGDDRIDVGFVRNDQSERSGQGRIGQLALYLAPSIPGSQELKIEFGNAEVLSFDNSREGLTTTGDAVFVGGTAGNTILFANNLVSMYPNPATNAVTLKSSLTQSGVVRMANVLGQIVLETAIEGHEHKTISLEGLTQGAYWVTIENPTGRWSQKLIVQ